MFNKLNKSILEKIKGKKLKDIRAGWSSELEMEFEDNTIVDIDFRHYPDGTIREIILDIKERHINE